MSVVHLILAGGFLMLGFTAAKAGDRDGFFYLLIVSTIWLATT